MIADGPNPGPREVSAEWTIEILMSEPPVTPTPGADLPVCNSFEFGCTDAVCLEIPDPSPLGCQTLWPTIDIPLGWMDGPIRLIWSDFPGIADLEIPGVELCLETISPVVSLFGWNAVAIVAIFGGLLLIAMISKEIRS